ncbi:hypothetical protein RhiJN_05053 [Ceratobasidium sp. AG-Ba]|nr:hypothetical protein RhiJN_05053 [Ceratobasidium sp. AG-Ba]
MSRHPGGYQDSDDESDHEIDKNRLETGGIPTYAPPRMTLGPSRPAFQLPRLGSVSSHTAFSAVGPSSSASAAKSTTVNTEHLGALSVPSDAGNRAPENTLRVGPDPTTLTHSRSTLALERQINAVLTAQDELKRLNDEQHRRTDERLDRVLDAVGQLIDRVGNNTFISAPPSRSLTPFDNPILNPTSHLANPVADAKLIATAAKVCDEFRSRIGHKEVGPEINAQKEHVRVTWYQVLGITSSKGIGPHFEDEYGEPDTLPAMFVDPETNYCRPYPHWTQPMDKQTAWLGTYLLRFRSTIPNDQSSLSNSLRNMSDERILTLLHDGPFKTAQTVWYNMNKTEEEIQSMKSNSRRYQRSERKAALRSRYISTIPSLQSPEWEYLSHSGYVSPDESDDEGCLVTKRPSYRAQWEINFYEAIRVAEHEKAKAKQGLCPRFSARRLEVVRRPVPQLERGKGRRKTIVRIALCGLSKSWREANPLDLAKYKPLINVRAATKPDIGAFLRKHPLPESAEDAETFNLDLDGKSDVTEDNEDGPPETQNPTGSANPHGDVAQVAAVEKSVTVRSDGADEAHADQYSKGKARDVDQAVVAAQLGSAEEPEMSSTNVAAHIMHTSQGTSQTYGLYRTLTITLFRQLPTRSPAVIKHEYPSLEQLAPILSHVSHQYVCFLLALNLSSSTGLQAPEGLLVNRSQLGPHLQTQATDGQTTDSPQYLRNTNYSGQAAPDQHSVMPPPPPLGADNSVPNEMPQDQQPPKKRTRLSAQKDLSGAQPTATQPKRRGRPPGAKNKKKKGDEA